MDTNTLREYTIYFKQGGSATTKAARFEVRHGVGQRDINFFLPDGLNAAIYAPYDVVAAIVSVEQYSGGQEYFVHFKSSFVVTVRAHTFIDSGSRFFSFRDAENNYLPDVYVDSSEVLAIVPSDEPAPAGSFPAKK
jgi:hypothetical protein